ncbi:hypothetical protein E4T39_01596 [Aureobasidium subglaciale]|nr:hypothetical protein E4T39_01596 [Aureobasidium subglaciale]
MSLVPTLPTFSEPAILTCIAPVNEARAMRIAEILSDFRHLQHFIANIRANPSAEEYYEEGYCVLRQCAREAQALLNQPFDCQGPEPDGNDEEEKAQLQRPNMKARVMVDASIRRFKIQQTYLKASAALRWVNSRTAILGGNRPQPVHAPALQQIANTMRSVSLPSSKGFVTSTRFWGCMDPIHALGNPRVTASHNREMLDGLAYASSASS